MESLCLGELGRDCPCTAGQYSLDLVDPAPFAGTNRISRPCPCPHSSWQWSSPSPWFHWTTWPRLVEARSRGALANQARVLRDMSWSSAAAAEEEDGGCSSDGLPRRSERTANKSANHSLWSSNSTFSKSFFSFSLIKLKKEDEIAETVSDGSNGCAVATCMSCPPCSEKPREPS